MKRLPDGWVLKEKYDFNCFACGHEMSFSPSILMDMGINSGNARCSRCQSFLHLEIDCENNEGLSILHGEWIKNEKKVTGNDD